MLTTRPSNLWVLYRSLSFVKFDRNFKANIYSFIKAVQFSKFKRRKYIRRKHLYSWAPYFNILASWSHNYRFNKKLSSFVLGSTLLKTRTLGFNSLSLFPKNYLAEEVLQDFFSSSFPTRLHKFTKNYSSTLPKLAFSNPSFVLAPKIANFRTTWSHASGTPFFYWYDKTLLPTLLDSPNLTPSISDLLFSVWLSLLKTIYQLFTLLITSTLRINP